MLTKMSRCASFGYICPHLIYILISLCVGGIFFGESDALFTLVKDRYDENDTMWTREEISGFLRKIKTLKTSLNNSTHQVSFQDTPSLMRIMVSVMALEYTGYLVCMAVEICHLLQPLLPRTCPRFEKLLLAYIVLTYISICVAHVLYIELVGKHVGFNWEHLTPTFYTGFVNAFFTAPISLVFIVLVHKQKRSYTETNGLVYFEYEYSKSESADSSCQPNSSSDNQSISMFDSGIAIKSMSMFKQSLSNTYRHIDNANYITNIRRMVETLCKLDSYDVDLETERQNPTTTNIIEIASIGNESAFQAYLKKMRQIESFASNFGTKLISPEQFPGQSSVKTKEFANRHSCLGKVLNRNINEYYMFHGTTVDNLEHIEENGFDMNKVRYGPLGRAIYLSDDPVKVDQYTGERLRYMLVCRVLLGDSVIVTRMDGHRELVSWCSCTSAPCKVCLKPEPDCHCIDSTKFDSVIYGSQFVVYEACSCFPEFAVLYKRVK